MLFPRLLVHWKNLENSCVLLVVKDRQENKHNRYISSNQEYSQKVQSVRKAINALQDTEDMSKD